MASKRKYTFESLESIVSFYEAIKLAERIVATEKPDLIVGPLRGAEPIIESMRVIAGLEGRELPRVVYIETGSIDHIFDGEVRKNPIPLNTKQKLGIVISRLAPYLVNHWGLSVLLVDEVEHGGSIVKNYDLVNEALNFYYPRANYDFKAVAICGPQDKCSKFEQLTRMGKIIPVYVRDLFTVDKTKFLSPLIRRSDDVRREGTYPMDLKPKLYAQIVDLHTIRQGITSQ